MTISYKDEIDGESSDETIKKMKSIQNDHFKGGLIGFGNFMIRVFRQWELARARENAMRMALGDENALERITEILNDKNRVE